MTAPRRPRTGQLAGSAAWPQPPGRGLGCEGIEVGKGARVQTGVGWGERDLLGIGVGRRKSRCCPDTCRKFLCTLGSWMWRRAVGMLLAVGVGDCYVGAGGVQAVPSGLSPRPPGVPGVWDPPLHPGPPQSRPQRALSRPGDGKRVLLAIRLLFPCAGGEKKGTPQTSGTAK